MSAAPRTLEQVLTDALGEVPILRKHGQHAVADAMAQLVADVRDATVFLAWLSEAEAMLRSSHSAEWLRKRFAGWERQGLARWNPHNPNERQYMQAVVPHARNLEAAIADARREAERVTT